MPLLGEQPTVLLLHRNRMLRLGAARVLEDAGFETRADVRSGEDLTRHIDSHANSVVVCEDDWPSSGSLAVLAAAITRNIGVALVVEPSRPTYAPWQLFQAVVSAADDGTQLEQAVTSVAAGDTWLDPSLRLRDAGVASALDRLTGREEAVLRGIARGWGNREIAADLHLSENTIKSHVASVLRKLGVGTRAAAAALAVKLGIAEDPPPQLVRRGLLQRPARPMLASSFAEASTAALEYLARRERYDSWIVARREGDHWVSVNAAPGRSSLAAAIASSYPWDTTVCARVLSGLVPQVIPRISALPEHHRAPAAQEAGIESYVGAPIQRADGSLYGTLCGLDAVPHAGAKQQLLREVEQLASILGLVAP